MAKTALRNGQQSLGRAAPLAVAAVLEHSQTRRGGTGPGPKSRDILMKRPPTCKSHSGDDVWAALWLHVTLRSQLWKGVFCELDRNRVHKEFG